MHTGEYQPYPLAEHLAPELKPDHIVKSRRVYYGLKYQLITGMNTCFGTSTIQSIAYADPEIAWMGITEEQARAIVSNIQKACFHRPQ